MDFVHQKREWIEEDLTVLSRLSQATAKISRLEEETSKWQRKYEEIFQEQCKTRSLENQLRSRAVAAEVETAKFKAISEAQRDIIEWLIKL